jgi:hypothetical protein
MTQEERKSLRFAYLEPSAFYGFILLTQDVEPLKEGEVVRYDPEWYRHQNPESQAIAKVGKIRFVDKTHMALGKGDTYEEQYKNQHPVGLSWGEVAATEYEIDGFNIAVASGGPCDWLPGLDTMD